jgi:hypothetical protein
MERHTTAGNQDKRSAPRYPVALLIVWEKGTGMTCNVSTTGAFFTTEGLLSAGALLAFSLQGEHPWEGLPLYLYGRGSIVRIEPYEGQWGIGLHFTSFRFESAAGSPTGAENQTLGKADLKWLGIGSFSTSKTASSRG